MTRVEKSEVALERMSALEGLKHVHYVSSKSQTIAWECTNCKIFEFQLERPLCNQGCISGHVVAGGMVNESTDSEDTVS
jgi:hypothetical protein